jgi:TP901 family phage tail tape measure protein
MANSLTNVRLKATESESIIDKMGETLKRTLTWSISSSIINKMAGSIQEAYGYVKHLDTSLNDIRIVTEYSAEAMDKFAEKANKAAITLGKSTTDYTEAALIYYQQGLGEEDVAARTDVTLKTANVTQQSTAQVSEELTAIWNGYKVNAEEAEAYIDKVAKVAAVTAADLEEMATGMSKVASAANVMGVDIDQMNAILATTISVTR